MPKQSAYKYDGAGPYVLQDPDDDLDYTFDFNDQTKGPALETGEQLSTLVEMVLTRLDGAAITTEQVHGTTITTTYAAAFVRNLIVKVDYRLECTVQTNSTPPRRISRSFRLFCRER